MCKSICTSGQTLIVLKKTNLLCYQTLGTSTAPENIQREELKITNKFIPKIYNNLYQEINSIIKFIERNRTW